MPTSVACWCWARTSRPTRTASRATARCWCGPSACSSRPAGGGDAAPCRPTRRVRRRRHSMRTCRSPTVNCRRSCPTTALRSPRRKVARWAWCAAGGSAGARRLNRYARRLRGNHLARGRRERRDVVRQCCGARAGEGGPAGCDIPRRGWLRRPHRHRPATGSPGDAVPHEGGATLPTSPCCTPSCPKWRPCCRAGRTT